MQYNIVMNMYIVNYILYMTFAGSVTKVFIFQFESRNTMMRIFVWETRDGMRKIAKIAICIEVE